MANQAVLLTNWQDFLTELMVQEQLVFGYETRLLSLLTGMEQPDPKQPLSRDPNQQRFDRAMDPNRDYFHGKKVTIPLQLSEIPGSAAIAENGTWPQPAPFDTAQATLNLKSRVTPIALSLEVERDARNGATSALETVAALTASAYRQAARVDNDFLHGNGDALLQAATSANADADGLVMTVGTSAQFDQLTVGRVVDVRVVADGTDPGQGLRRKIASVDRTAGTVTFSTTQVASDGGSGNITLSTNDVGIYIDSSFGNAPQGLAQAVATTGIFEGVNKATTAAWQGISVDGASAALSDDLLNTAVYYLEGNGVAASDFGIAHNLTVDPYKQAKTSQVKYTPQDVVIRSGVAGVVFQGAAQEFPIIKDRAAPRKKCRLITKSVLRIYGDDVGPKFIDDDGSMWRFFSRKSTKEADLFDRWQLGVRDCGKLAEIKTLSE